MRAIKSIKADQERLQKQMGATMNSRTMSGEDIRITLEGFAIQKQKLDQELSHAKRIRNIEVKEATIVSDRSKEPQSNIPQL